MYFDESPNQRKDKFEKLIKSTMCAITKVVR